MVLFPSAIFIVYFVHKETILSFSDVVLLDFFLFLFFFLYIFFLPGLRSLIFLLQLPRLKAEEE